MLRARMPSYGGVHARLLRLMRIDRYDIIGMVLLALVVALWVLHFSLPTPPPDNYRNLGSAVPAAEPGAIRRG